MMRCATRRPGVPAPAFNTRMAKYLLPFLLGVIAPLALVFYLLIG